MHENWLRSCWKHLTAFHYASTLISRGKRFPLSWKLSPRLFVTACLAVAIA